MSVMRLLIEGLTGTYNRGGEGIIRGTCAILRQSLPAGTSVTFAATDPSGSASRSASCSRAPRSFAACSIADGPRSARMRSAAGAG
jgi:hypothetical protein